MLVCAALLAIVLPVVPTKKVLVIGIDGCRPDALARARTPYIDAIVREGCLAVGKAEPLTVSGPCWSSILCGVWANKHGVTDNGFAGANYKDYPDFLTQLKNQRPLLRTVAVTAWKPIIDNIIRVADHEGPLEDGDEATALEAAVQIGIPGTDVVFVHFDAVDGAGHSFGYGPDVPMYLKSIEETDKNVGLLLGAMKARASYASEDWLVILTSDHGGTGTGHGLPIPEHINVPFIVSGPSAAEVFSVVPTQCDVAPTVFAHLGITPTREIDWDGVPVGLKKADSLALSRNRDAGTVQFEPSGGFFVEKAEVVLSCSLENVGIRVTTDGSLPTETSELFLGRMAVKGDTLLRARAFRNGEPVGPSSFANYKVQPDYLVPVSQKGTSPGLSYRTVKGSFRNLASVRFENADTSGVVGAPTEKVGPTNDFAASFQGYINVPKNAVYRFALHCDDGAVLTIGGRLVVDHDGLHEASTKTGFVGLQAGWHNFRLDYFQAGGSAALRLAMGLQGETLEDVRPSMFAHSANSEAAVSQSPYWSRWP